LLLSELNRFTINSDYHNHYDDTSRQAQRDDGVTSPRIYWLRSAGISTGSPVALVWTTGVRGAADANATNIGFRPSLKIVLDENT